MNSKSIEANNQEVYKKFYRENKLIISQPLLLNWAGDIFSNYTGIRIKQKLPFRIYLGINRIKEKKVKLNSISYFDINEDKFIETSLGEYAPCFSQYKQYFYREYKNEINKNGGIEITVLSETSRGIGLGFSSVITMLFIIAFEKLYYKDNYLNFANIGDIEINDFLNANTNIDRIFRKSLKLNRDLGIRINRIENQISSFFDSYYPIVSFIEDIEKNIDNIDIETVQIFGYRLNELEKSLPEIPFAPIDYGIIYSGRPVLTDIIANTNEDSYKWTSEIKKKLGIYFDDELGDILPTKKPLFYKTFVSEKGNVIKDTYGKLMGAISLELLNTMIKLYSPSYVESSMKNFIDTVNKLRHGNYITRKSSKTYYDFLHSVFDNFPSGTRILGIAPSDTTIMGGTAIFVCPYEGFRKDLSISISKTQEKIPGVKFLYSNWSDGVESNGFILKQDIENKIYSKYVNRNSIIISSSKYNSFIEDISFLDNMDLSGLTIDLISNKIYLDGRKITSKELHSQSATANILEILLENIGSEISNKKLPKSSYSKSKNEMNGKVILPLLKLIEKNTENTINLSCRGTLDNYSIRLDEGDLPINIIKKVR